MERYKDGIPVVLWIVCTLAAACQDKKTEDVDTGTCGGEACLAPTDDSAGPDTGSDTDTDTDATCDNPDLVWRSANKTWYISYPDPGSEECIEYNGCQWAGWFAGCDDQKTEEWVATHNIVAAFPDFKELKLHDLCLRKGASTIVVTVLDTCGDSDCDGCCTQNLGNAEQLIDLESYTNERFGVPDGRIEWADLGPTQGGGCE
jgi:hypothetical protein